MGYGVRTGFQKKSNGSVFERRWALKGPALAQKEQKMGAQWVNVTSGGSNVRGGGMKRVQANAKRPKR